MKTSETVISASRPTLVCPVLAGVCVGPFVSSPAQVLSEKVQLSPPLRSACLLLLLHQLLLPSAPLCFDQQQKKGRALHLNNKKNKDFIISNLLIQTIVRDAKACKCQVSVN